MFRVRYVVLATTTIPGGAAGAQLRQAAYAHTYTYTYAYTYRYQVAPLELIYMKKELKGWLLPSMPHRARTPVKQTGSHTQSATQGSHPSLADRVSHTVCYSHTCGPRLGQSRTHTQSAIYTCAPRLGQPHTQPATHACEPRLGQTGSRRAGSCVCSAGCATRGSPSTRASRRAGAACHVESRGLARA